MPVKLGPTISRLDLRAIHERRELAAVRGSLLTRLRDVLRDRATAEPVLLSPEALLEMAKRQIWSELTNDPSTGGADASVYDSYPGNLFLSALIDAANGGDAEAQYLYGMCRLLGIQIMEMNTTAVTSFRKAAMQGYVPAQYQLGLCYSSGTGLAKNESLASEWLLEAAQNGHTEAQILMAERYQHGVGVKKSFLEARKWTAQAARSKTQGDWK